MRGYPLLRLELVDLLIFRRHIVATSITCQQCAIRVNRSLQSCMAVALVNLVGLMLLLRCEWLGYSGACVLPSLLAELCDGLGLAF